MTQQRWNVWDKLEQRWSKTSKRQLASERLQDGGTVQGRSESRWRVIAHHRGGREARLARGGIRDHDAFLGHWMRGPAGLGVVASRWLEGGKAKAQGRGIGWGAITCHLRHVFFQNLLMYFGFLSRWERLLANIYSVYSYTWILIFFTFNLFIYFIVISNFWFCMLSLAETHGIVNYARAYIQRYTNTCTHKNKQRQKKGGGETEDVTTISKPQSLTSVRIKDCTLRVPNKTTTLCLYE